MHRGGPSEKTNARSPLRIRPHCISPLIMPRLTQPNTNASTATIGFEGKLWLTADSEGEKTHRSVNLLGRVYEYFLTRFASAQGKNGGVAKCEVQSANVEVKAVRPFVIRNSSFGISPARRLAVMNLALRGIEADFVDCMVALPGQLFYSTKIPVCLWFLAKNKNADAKCGFHARRQPIAPAHSTP